MTMTPILYGRLSLAMFLQYAVWGAWISILPNYLAAPIAQGGRGFTANQIGWAIGIAGGIGAITAPFLAGQLADRRFNTERLLAALLLAGGAVQWYTAQQTTFAMWLLMGVLFSILYVPTLSLASALVFAHLPDARTQFPQVRVWGSIGFIAAMWAFPILYLQRDLHFQWMPPFLIGEQVPNATPLLVKSLEFSGLIAAVHGIYCLTLPRTPPRREAAAQPAFVKAFGLIRRRSFAVLLLTTIPIGILHYTFWMQVGPFLSHAGMQVKDIPAAVSVGPMAEILFMVLLGLVLRRVGFRRVIAAGCLAYAVRFGVFALDRHVGLPVLVAVQVVHGVCAAAFFAASFIYVDRIADHDARASAQAVFSIVLFGLAPIFAGRCLPLFESLTTGAGGVVDYGQFWLLLSGVSVVTAIGFALLFRDETSPEPRTDLATPAEVAPPNVALT